MSLSNIVRSSIGLKFVMAITGASLFGFVIAHLLGNLLIFGGADTLNSYAQGLRDLPYELLWFLRGGLLIVFLVHISAAITLSRSNSQARPVGYVKNFTIQATSSSRSMVLSGFTLLAFLIYHLAHYTFKILPNTEVSLDEMGNHDVFRMVVDGFSQPIVSVAYVFFMIILGIHLQHGISSLFQSLGFQKKTSYVPLKKLGFLLAWSVVIANISIPVSVLLGCISL